MADADDRVSLTVPARGEYVDVIRTVVGREAHRLGFSFDGIEDVCLAADEATVLLLALSGGARWIEVSTGVAAEAFEVSLSASPADSVPWPPRSLDDDVRWQVLHALADEVRVESVGGCPGFVISQRAR